MFIKWFGKQFILGQIYNWAKERLSGLLLTNNFINFSFIYS